MKLETQHIVAVNDLHTSNSTHTTTSSNAARDDIQSKQIFYWLANTSMSIWKSS